MMAITAKTMLIFPLALNSSAMSGACVCAAASKGKKAKIKISKWVNIHPHNIAQKTEIIIEHFRQKVAHLLDNQAKAMVVTSSRQSAIRYKDAFDKYRAKYKTNHISKSEGSYFRVEDWHMEVVKVNSEDVYTSYQE